MVLTRSPGSELLGAQRPRVCWSPPAASSAGAEAVDLARMAGLGLDPWQELVLKQALGERANGLWAALSVGVVAPRQNGKDTILEARELVGLFLLGEQLITHSAHQFDTSLEAFRRLLQLIEETPEFDRRVQRVARSHGEEGITLKGGQRIRFRTRTKGGGRGFGGDCMIFNEAMILPETALGALMPTLSARPNPQIWYMGSPVDQLIHEHGVVLARVRERGLARDPVLAYFECSLDCTLEEAMDEAIAGDPEMWAQPNPALGRRITQEFVAEEQGSMDPRTFAVERLGVGDWPDTRAGRRIISAEAWQALADLDSTPAGRVCFALDVTPDLSGASISAAGTRADGLQHVEVVDRRRGTGWVVPRLAQLLEDHDAAEEPVMDASGPAGALLPQLQQRGITVKTVSAQEHAQAFGTFVDAAANATFRHLNTPELVAALKGATKRALGDAWAWSRKSSAVDISPLVSSTLALWGHLTAPEEPDDVDPDMYRMDFGDAQ